MKNHLNKTSTLEIPKSAGLSISGPWPAFFFEWSELEAQAREGIVTDVLQGAFGAEAEAEDNGVRLDDGIWVPIAVLGGAWLEEIGSDDDNLFAAVMSQLDGILMVQKETGAVQLIGDGGEHAIIAPNVAALEVGPYRAKEQR